MTLLIRIDFIASIVLIEFGGDVSCSVLCLNDPSLDTSSNRRSTNSYLHIRQRIVSQHIPELDLDRFIISFTKIACLRNRLCRFYLLVDERFAMMRGWVLVFETFMGRVFFF